MFSKAFTKNADPKQVAQAVRLWRILSLVSLLAVSNAVCNLYLFGVNFNADSCVVCHGTTVADFLWVMRLFDLGLSSVFALSGLAGAYLARRTRLYLYTNPTLVLILIVGVAIYTAFTLLPSLLYIVSSLISAT